MTHAQDSGQQGQGSPRAFSAGTLLAVCAINLVILGYAVHVTEPAAHGTVPAAVAPAESAGSPLMTSGAPLAHTITRVDLPGTEEVQASFLQHCAACHGLEGRGDGPATEQLYPKPRDFVASPLRFASTGGSKDEVLAAIERTIADGVPRSAMPGFHGVLSEADIAGLARHVLELRESQGGPLDAAPPADPIDMGQRPPLTEELLARGKELYTALACVTCHGESGQGDGPAARDLRDSIGRPVRAADLASGLFKSGQSPQSLARTILHGVPGTPMTPYGAVLIRDTGEGAHDATDLWALVAYVESFTSRVKELGESSGAEIAVARANDAAMLEDPTHADWIGVRESQVSVRPLWQRHEETNFIRVRAAKDDARLAICIEWRDATFDAGRDHAAFPDATAVMFALGDDVPALPMGVVVEGHEPEAPVNIWHWKAERQLQAVAAAGIGFPAAPGQTQHTGTWLFRAEDSRLPALVSGDTVLDWEAAALDPARRTAETAGNVLSVERLLERPALESNALGFGTLTPQEPSDQDLSSSAVWSNGTWRVVMCRPLATAGAQDVHLPPEVRVPVAFAVWDGAKGDRGGAKLVSGWHWLIPGSEP